MLFKRGRATRGSTPRHTVALSFYIAFTESVAEKSPKAEHCKTICLTFLIMGFFVSANCLTQNDNTTTLSSRLHVVRSMQCMRSGEISYNCPYGRDVSTTVDMTLYREAPRCHFASMSFRLERSGMEKSLIIDRHC